MIAGRFETKPITDKGSFNRVHSAERRRELVLFEAGEAPAAKSCTIHSNSASEMLPVDLTGITGTAVSEYMLCAS